MPLTQEGYIKSTVQELRDRLTDQVRQYVPDFSKQPADLQNNLIDTSIADILQYEDMMSTLFNAYSPAFANKEIFRKFAESVGLRAKTEFKAQVVLTFKGKFGDLIPQNCIVTPKGKESVQFLTAEAAILSTTGEASVLAYSETDETFQPETLTNLKSILSDGITVTNKAASLKYIPEETEEQLMRRAQAKMRSARLGGKLYATSLLNSVEGVDPRLVAFYNVNSEQTIDSNKMYVKGIEAVIGGGKDEDVALALYKSFLETQKLVSSPSSNEKNRTTQVTIYVNNNAEEILFTRPKLVEIGLQLNLSFSSSLSSPIALQSLTIDAVTNYINSLQVGIPVSQYALIELVIPILTNAGIPAYTLTSVKFKYLTNENKQLRDFSINGFISEIEKDCYPILTNYTVEINK